MLVKNAATHRPVTFQKPRFSRRSKQHLTLPALLLKTNPAACPPSATLPARTATLTCFTPGTLPAKTRPFWRCNAKLRRWALASASPTAKAQGCRPSSHIFSARTPKAFGAVTPARATACRHHPLPRHQVRTATCSATRGTPPCAMHAT